MKFLKIITPLLIILLGVYLMFALIASKSDPPPREFTAKAKIVETIIVRLDRIPSEITAYGRMTSAQPVDLYSEAAGTLQKGALPFQPGQSFKKGDLLLKIDDRQIRLDINNAKSDLLNALASVLPEIKLDFPDQFIKWQNYFNALNFDEPTPLLPQADNQKIKLFLSRFNVYKYYFLAQNLEIKLDKHVFYAPFDGSIVTANLRTGSTARNGTLLGQIINLERMEVEAPLPADEISWINLHKTVTLTSREIAGEWKGKIVRIGKSIDARTQTVPVFISIDPKQSSHIYNGIFLEAKIGGKFIENGVSIPRKSLYNQKFVYIIRDGKLEYREVQISRKQSDSVIVSGGLDDGDQLVVEALQGVSPGMLAQSKSAADITGESR